MTAYDDPRSPTGPGFWTTVWLMIRLRFLLLARRLSGGGWLSGGFALVMVTALATGLGVGSYLLFATVPVVSGSRIWSAFFLGLYCFLMGLFWVLWPLVAAQVDEAYELGRYLHYPVRPARLYLIQTAVALAEPSVLFFYPALVGAGLGLAKTLQPGPFATVGLMVCFALMNVAVGRGLLGLFLNVMTSRRSAEILFGAFLAALGVAALLPPVDASWLFAQLESMATAAPEDLGEIIRATGAVTDTPPGWLAYGLRAASRGRTTTAVSTALGMLTVGAVAWLAGLVLLKRFYRGGRDLVSTGRKPAAPSPAQPPPQPGWRLPGASDGVSAVFQKEWRTMTSNPKGRMIFAVPFFLLILLKVVGAPTLLQYLWGTPWAAILLALLGLYVLAVLAGQFFAAGFGYDGQGVRLVFLTPAPPETWLRGRNLAQAAFATLQFTGLGLAVFGLLPSTRGTGLALPLLGFPFGLLVLLAMGNLLAATHPQRYHLSLSRRDRPQPAAALAVLGCLAFVSLSISGALVIARLTSLPATITLAPLVGAGALLYRLLLPIAARRTSANRDRILTAIARS
jgi:ABC-2 type transport system permease protein